MGAVALAIARETLPPKSRSIQETNSRQGQALTAICLAVAVGFEPTVGLTPHNISSVAPSAARTRHREERYRYACCVSKAGPVLGDASDLQSS